MCGYPSLSVLKHDDGHADGTMRLNASAHVTVRIPGAMIIKQKLARKRSMLWVYAETVRRRKPRASTDVI